MTDFFGNTSADERSELANSLGAYALDALDASERLTIETRIHNDPRLRDEADELSQIAAMLGTDVVGTQELPHGAWERFAPLLDKPTGEAPVTDLSYRRQRRFRQVAVGTMAAAIIGLLVTVAVQQRRIGSIERSARSLDNSASAAATAPGAKRATLKPNAGGTAALVTILPDGTGYLDLASLPAIDPSHVWQLWSLNDAGAVSLGVTGDHSKSMAFHTSPGVHSFAVTIEPNGGSVKATTSPIAIGSTD